jgi:hypothetical protein
VPLLCAQLTLHIIAISQQQSAKATQQAGEQQAKSMQKTNFAVTLQQSTLFLDAAK